MKRREFVTERCPGKALHSKGIPRFRDKDNHKTTAVKVWEGAM
jgi:hypothetical protein